MALIGFLIAIACLFTKGIINGVVFKRVHGFNISKFLDSKVLEKQIKINKASEVEK